MESVSTSGSIYAKEVKGFDEYKYLMPLSSTITISNPLTDEELAYKPAYYNMEPFTSYEELLDYRLEGIPNIETYSIDINLYVIPNIYCRATQEKLVATIQISAALVKTPDVMLQVIDSFIKGAIGVPL